VEVGTGGPFETAVPKDCLIPYGTFLEQGRRQPQLQDIFQGEFICKPFKNLFTYLSRTVALYTGTWVEPQILF
jgi:hypothetical protein